MLHTAYGNSMFAVQYVTNLHLNGGVMKWLQTVRLIL